MTTFLVLYTEAGYILNVDFNRKRVSKKMFFLAESVFLTCLALGSFLVKKR